ncbi:MAG: HD domain-containing phosphohydrolase [Anaerolineae bacterium]|jgi:PAS domain S-box-containing protein|nr:HD domain-containing phosphohydrolase [Anaerolineae bacterium]
MNKDHTILVVSPNEIDANATAIILENKGYRMLVATNWREVKEAVTDNLPQVVLLSLDEAPLWALDLLWELKENLPHSQIVILTEDMTRQVVADALNVGVRGVLTKPLDTYKLNQLIQIAIAENRKAEGLRKSEDYFKTIVNTAPDVILHIDLQGNIKDINRIPWYLTGRKLVGVSPLSFIEENYHSGYQKTIQHVLESGEIVTCEYELTTMDGQRVWCEASIGPIKRNGIVDGISLVSRDITKRMAYIEEIESQRNELDLLFELGKKINATLNIREVYDHLLEQVARVMDCKQFTVSSFSPEDQMIRCEYFVYDNQQIDVTSFPPIPLNPEGKGTQSRVIVSGKAMLLNDYQAYIRTSKKKFLVTDDGDVINEEEKPEDDDDVQRAAIIAPMIFQGETVGVIQVMSNKLNAYNQLHLHMIETACTQLAVASNNAMLYRQAQEEINERILAQRKLQESYDSTLMGWVSALERREKETAGHSKRVTELALRFAEKLNFPQEDRIHLWRGALLHDVGKLVIPDSILLKQGSLDEEEWEVMRMHGEYAYEWLSSIDYLKPVLDIPRYHHERWDGKGYPKGLKGEEIPLAARMFTLIDQFDALSNDRPYRKAWRKKRVLRYLMEESGRIFDPILVDVFIEMINENKPSRFEMKLPIQIDFNSMSK